VILVLPLINTKGGVSVVPEPSPPPPLSSGVTAAKG
jgi:hypothetical protein